MIAHFTKMHGAGNDFVAIDDWRKTVPWTNIPLMGAMATRRTGVGCEGIILVQPPEPEGCADFRMRFLNPDGREAGMCGNGARCAALFAYRHGLAGRQQRIQTGSGFVNAEILDARPFAGVVRLTTAHPKPATVRNVVAAGNSWTCHCLDTGVPHAVVFVDDTTTVDVRTAGRALRLHADFAPVGVNVDFVQALADGSLRVRTYERGVEDESGACGTGALASALAAVDVLGMKLPLTLHVTSGDRLVVDVALGPDGTTAPTLTGPAREVYTGVVDLSAFALAGA